MALQCGRFSESGEEFLITRPDRLPREWYNYVWNESFLCQTTVDGAGGSFYRHPAGMRTQLNGGSRRIYVRNRQTGDCCGFPKGDPDDEVTFGQGYTTYRRKWRGIELSFQITVPKGIKGELWCMQVVNTTGEDLDLSVFSFMDISLLGYFTPFQILCLSSKFEPDSGVLTFVNTDSCCTSPYFNGFVASDAPVAGFDAVRGLFVGWQSASLETPKAVVAGKCTNTPYAGYGPAGVLQTELRVQADETKAVRYLYGIHESREEVAAAMKAAFAPRSGPIMQTGPSDEARAKNDRFVVDTPDAELNRLFNSWAKHNLRFCVDWTRIYSRGFRDVLQDAMGVTALDPASARESLLAAMAHVYRSGRCVRAWDAVSTTLSEEFYADGPVWIPLAVNAYIRETGDTAILDEQCPYLDGGKGSLLEHMLAAVRFLYEDRGRHGLCRIHDGDWCDTAHLLGKKGRGVGVWLTIALHKALAEVGELAEFLGDAALAGEMATKGQVLREVVNEAGWDGEWFLIAYNDDGRPIGTGTDATGRVFLNPQSWAVISGITSEQRRQACLKAIDEHLDSGVGPVLLSPPFTEMDRSIGTITGFAPGLIENGSCYCHAAAFKIVADCATGRGDRAYRTLRAIMPGGDADQTNPDADCPPFAFTNSRAALCHPYLGGRSLGIWATGTVAWCWMALTEWMLGVRKSFSGLQVDPCIPSEWSGFSVRRRYRGCEYEITVSNPDHVQCGVKEVTVAGEPFAGESLPIEPGRKVLVRVTMG